MSADEEVRRAIELFRVGHKDEAREILKGVLRQDRENPLAWAAMVQVAQSSQEATLCLRQVLRLKPGDPWATEQLQRLDAAASQSVRGSEPPSVDRQTPGAMGSLSKIKALHSVSTHDPLARAREQLSALQTQAVQGEEELDSLPARQPSSAADAQGKTDTSPWYSRLGILLWLLIGVIIIAVGYAVWDEFFATYPEDEQKAIQSACDWTKAMYRTDYEKLSALVCGKYASEIEDARKANVFVSTFATSLGVDMGREPPRTLRCEIESMRGSNARVHIYGLMGDLDLDELEFWGTAFIDERIYVMRREGGDWKWCGEELVY